MSHHHTQPEEVDFFLMAMMQQGTEIDTARQDDSRCYGALEVGTPYAVPPNPRVQAIDQA